MIKSLGMICEMGHVDRLCLRQPHGTQIVIGIAKRQIFERFMILRCIALIIVIFHGSRKQTDEMFNGDFNTYGKEYGVPEDQ